VTGFQGLAGQVVLPPVVDGLRCVFSFGAHISLPVGAGAHVVERFALRAHRSAVVAHYWSVCAKRITLIATAGRHLGIL
jgi:hypothetical protein